LRLGVARDGARGWLAVAGGIDVPIVLGSRATCLAASFGGYAGRALRAGDVLSVGRATYDPPPGLRAPSEIAGDTAVTALRIVPGPQLGRFPIGALDVLAATAWTVDPNSDRSGIRLAPGDGDTASRLSAVAGIAPEGTTLGAIQVTADGTAIVLGPDRPVTGGYAKPAVVIAADVGRLALLRPGDSVRFVPTDIATACALLGDREARMPRAAS
jgi:allophanate hydrolase subunit 2